MSNQTLRPNDPSVYEGDDENANYATARVREIARRLVLGCEEPQQTEDRPLLALPPNPRDLSLSAGISPPPR